LEEASEIKDCEKPCEVKVEQFGSNGGMAKKGKKKKVEIGVRKEKTC
jgi:hypothetical protein